MAEGRCGSCCFMFVVYGPCFLLQAVGFFSHHWVSIDSCDTVGLFYRCCTQNSTGCFFDGKETYLNRTVLGFQATSFSVLLLAILSMCCTMCCSKDPDEDLGCCGCIMGCSVALYPVAGILSIVGCIVLAVDYSTSHLHWGFFLCVSAGCYMLFVTIAMCCCLIKSPPEGENENIREPVSQSGYDVNRDGQVWTVQPKTYIAQAEILHAHRTIDPITKQVSVTFRMLRHIRIFQHHNDI